jgi:hypothetical protein
LSTENADDDASVSLGMDRSSTCKPGSAACTDRLDLTMSKGGVMCLIIFAVGYSMVMLEDQYVPIRTVPMFLPPTRSLAMDALVLRALRSATRLTNRARAYGSLGIAFNKSVPMTLATGMIWFILASEYKSRSASLALVSAAARHNLLEFSEVRHPRTSSPTHTWSGAHWAEGGGSVGQVFLFLLVAMVYISTMEQMQVFESIKIWMLERGFGLKGMYWMCGLMAFLLAPFADSLTTALLVGAVCARGCAFDRPLPPDARRLVHTEVITIQCSTQTSPPPRSDASQVAMKLMGANKDYVAVSCISIVVACNAGGVISPFGDVTSLMVWQKEKLSFFAFFKLLLPGVVNWLVPAGIMVRLPSPT